MTAFIGTDSDGPFKDDMNLDTDLDLIAELADQAAQGAIIFYGVEDWQRSPLWRMLDMAVDRLRANGRTPASACSRRGHASAPLRRLQPDVKAGRMPGSDWLSLTPPNAPPLILGAGALLFPIGQWRERRAQRA